MAVAFSRRVLSFSMILIGVFLVALNCVGWFLIEPVAGRDQSQSGLIAGRHFRTISVQQARQEFSQIKREQAALSAEEKAQKLFHLVSNSFIHHASYMLQPWDNWALWLLSFWDSRYLNSIQDSDLLWSRGGGHCRQASMIYAAKGQELGLQTRLVLLTGHVVTEVQLPERGWVAVDPDLGIFWDVGVEHFGGKLTLPEIKHKLTQHGYSPDYADQITQIFLSQKDNHISNYPVSRSASRIEKLTSLACWIVPILLILIGILLLTGTSFPKRIN